MHSEHNIVSRRIALIAFGSLVLLALVGFGSCGGGKEWAYSQDINDEPIPGGSGGGSTACGGPGQCSCSGGNGYDVFCGESGNYCEWCPTGAYCGGSTGCYYPQQASACPSGYDVNCGDGVCCPSDYPVCCSNKAYCGESEGACANAGNDGSGTGGDFNCSESNPDVQCQSVTTCGSCQILICGGPSGSGCAFYKTSSGHVYSCDSSSCQTAANEALRECGCG
jgi:hypothetical protein